MLVYILLQSFASLLPRLNEAEVEVESTCQQLNAGPIIGQSSLRGEGHRSSMTSELSCSHFDVVGW